MSEQSNFVSECAGKVRHATAALAHAVFRKQRKSPGMNVYRCPSCGGWHIGRQARGRNANRPTPLADGR